MKTRLIAVSALALLLSFSPAAEVIHYWDFDTQENDVPSDLVGGVATSATGNPVVSVHETYGEAYAGAGKSLNSELLTSDFLVADVFNPVAGGDSAMQFGTGSFSFSYWSWDASDLDGDVRGPRVFDCLNNTNTGIQLASNASGIFNYRMDDDLGGVIISNNLLGAITQDDAKWIHVAVNVDRENNLAEIFFDDTSQGSYDLSALTGNILPSQDMLIGVINGGGGAGAAQQCGLDDLAFYTGLLTEADRAGLAAGTTTPATITEGPAIPFKITSVEIDDEGVVSMTWNSVPDQLYAVDFSVDMRAWQELLDEHPSGGAETSFQHTPGVARAFYRVRIPD